MFRLGFLKPLILLCILLLSLQTSSAQDAKLSFLAASDTLHRPRLWLISGTSLTAYTATMIAMNAVWYKDYPRSSFHFHNDLDTWLQMDKVGHSWTAYVESELAMNLFQWSGVESRKAAWIGAAAGSLFQGTIEVLDGYSQEWGASATDLVANSLGSALLLGQELHWGEQRIRLKWSFHKVDYSDQDQLLQERTQDLFGRQVQQMMLKNYNGQSYWLSVNPASFMHSECRIPDWLNVAIGYGIEDVYGGSDNIWEAENGTLIDYSNISRKREIFFSLDIDFRRIETNSRLLKTLFGVVNVFKVPAPALSFRQDEGLILYPLYW